MRFRVDLKIFVFLVLFYLTKQIKIYAFIMLYAFFHEIGHLFAGILLGMKPEKIEIMPFGFSVSFKLRPKDYNKKVNKANLLEVKKIVVAFAGPLTNIFIIIISIYLKLSIFLQLMIIYANVLIVIFNLLPIYPLDGGRILKGFIHIYKGKKLSEKYINNISLIVISILTAIASIAIYYFKNIAIFFVIMYLWFIVLKENKRYMSRCKLEEMIKEYESKN